MPALWYIRRRSCTIYCLSLTWNSLPSFDHLNPPLPCVHYTLYLFFLIMIMVMVMVMGMGHGSWVMDHGSCGSWGSWGSWIMRIMDHEDHGSWGSWIMRIMDDYHHVDPPLGKGRLSPLQGLLHPRRCTFPSVQVNFPLSWGWPSPQWSTLSS